MKHDGAENESNTKFSINEYYSVERRYTGHENLIVLFSHSRKHHYRSLSFTADVLSVSDSRDQYFTNNPESLSKFIIQEASKYNKILLVGASKGGHGALYQGALIAQATGRKISVLVFSPIVNLNKNINNLKIPSYLRMLEAAERNKKLKSNLDASSYTVTSFPPNTLSVYTVYGAGHPTDGKESLSLIGAKHLALPMYHHESILPFLCDTTDQQAITKTVLLLHDKAAEEHDIAHLLSEGANDALISDISGVPKQPKLRV